MNSDERGLLRPVDIIQNNNEYDDDGDRQCNVRKK